MAESKENWMTQGMTGLVGRLLVFRRYFGRTIVAKRPSKIPRVLSTAQQDVQERFKDSARYATAAIQDPVKREAYEAMAVKPQSAYNIAFADYFNRPELSQPQLTGYNGQPGDVIRVRATDDFLVTGVTVAIIDVQGQVLEEGPAIPLDNGLDWEYTATAINPDIGGNTIRFTATDTPGNTTVLEHLIPD